MIAPDGTTFVTRFASGLSARDPLILYNGDQQVAAFTLPRPVGLKVFSRRNVEPWLPTGTATKPRTFTVTTGRV